MWHDNLVHSYVCMEGQRNFTEDSCEDKLSLIPDLNWGTSRYEADLGTNFLFTSDLFGFCVMQLTHDNYQ